MVGKGRKLTTWNSWPLKSFPCLHCLTQFQTPFQAEVWAINWQKLERSVYMVGKTMPSDNLPVDWAGSVSLITNQGRKDGCSFHAHRCPPPLSPFLPRFLHFFLLISLSLLPFFFPSCFLYFPLLSILFFLPCTLPPIPLSLLPSHWKMILRYTIVILSIQSVLWNKSAPEQQLIKQLMQKISAINWMWV